MEIKRFLLLPGGACVSLGELTFPAPPLQLKADKTHKSQERIKVKKLKSSKKSDRTHKRSQGKKQVEASAGSGVELNGKEFCESNCCRDEKGK